MLSFIKDLKLYEVFYYVLNNMENGPQSLNSGEMISRKQIMQTKSNQVGVRLQMNRAHAQLGWFHYAILKAGIRSLCEAFPENMTS